MRKIAEFDTPHGKAALLCDDTCIDKIPSHVRVYDYFGDVDVVNSYGNVIETAIYYVGYGHAARRSELAAEAHHWLIEFMKLRHGVVVVSDARRRS